MPPPPDKIRYLLIHLFTSVPPYRPRFCQSTGPKVSFVSSRLEIVCWPGTYTYAKVRFFSFFFFLVGDWYGLEKSLILETGAGRSWFFGSLGGVVGEEVFNEVEFFLVLLFWGLGKVERKTVLYVWKMFMIRCVKIYKCIFVLLNFPQLHKHLEEILLLEILKCNVFERNQ